MRLLSAGNIQHQTIGNYELALGAILGTNMAMGTIGSREIRNNSILAYDLAKANRPESGGTQSRDSGAVEGTIIGVNPDKSLKYTYGNIKPGSIGRTELRNDCITTEKINPGAVTGGKLADYSAITSDNSPGITTNKIANEAVTGAKIANRTITGAKISQDGVVAYNMATNSVQTSALASKSVTRAKLSKAVTDELDTIGSGSASTGGAFLVATIGPLINKDNNPASSMDHPQDLNIRWVFDGAFPADRVDPTTRTTRYS